MGKIYIYAFMIITIIGFIKWYSDNQFDAGYNKHKAEAADIKDNAVKEDIAAVKTIIKWREKTKVVYRDKIKYIDRVKDSTNCADIKYVDMGFILR